MGERTGIEWTRHTFNPWWGCTKVSPGCAHCYAEAADKRYGGAHWGKGQPRRRTSATNWNEPRKWNRAAAKAGERRRVFCASMADVFDDEVPTEWRRDLLALIQECPALDWLLLTKRPQNVMRLLDASTTGGVSGEAWLAGLGEHVWIGTTVEDQQRADERIPELIRIPVRVHFLSCEPLLGPVTFQPPEWRGTSTNRSLWLEDIEWVIAGGESGSQARPMHPAWARGIRDECDRRTDMGRSWPLPFFFKQWGEWAPPSQPVAGFKNVHHVWADGRHCPYADLGTDGFRRVEGDGHLTMGRVGKQIAGRLLDGVTHHEFPRVACR